MTVLMECTEEEFDDIIEHANKGIKCFNKIIKCVEEIRDNKNIDYQSDDNEHHKIKYNKALLSEKENHGRYSNY